MLGIKSVVVPVVMTGGTSRDTVSILQHGLKNNCSLVALDDLYEVHMGDHVAAAAVPCQPKLVQDGTRVGVIKGRG